MDNRDKHVSRGELENILERNFQKWGKAYEMLAAGEEPTEHLDDSVEEDKEME